MKKIFLLFSAFSLICVFSVHSQSIVNTKHNLSVSGTGKIKASSETEICLFCHTPHSGRPVAPLWNRRDPGSNYVLYSSSTLQANPGQPDGSSILCLSCHDGTIAMGSVISRKSTIEMGGGSMLPHGSTNLETNLKNDHPVSFQYKSSLAASDDQLKDPSLITPPVSLKNAKVQCTSCHDPHKNIYTEFLVTPTQNSQLCNSCHQRKDWMASSHNTSPKSWNGLSPNPWAGLKSAFATVAENGCQNCHLTHNSGSNSLLLKYQAEENNCLDCHNGNAAAKNIAAQFAKPYRHNIYTYQGQHDPAEATQVNTMHVECVDCHNPHASRYSTANAPAVTGALLGVRGVSQNGSTLKSAANSYEICYRCHAGSPGAPSSPTARVIPQNNVRLEFAPGNPSYHAVAADGINPDIPSLIAPWTPSSRLYCTDCHSSDGNGSPTGPHGSSYNHILKFQYLTADNTIESASGYALCYSCHNRSSILSDNSFKYHYKHIVELKAPCNACHDPHGISATQGNSINNSNLINFATSIVSQNSSSQLKFEDLGQNKGRCYLKCHGSNHNPYSY